MKNVQTDRFHQIFPDHGEPKLPISIYNKLLDTMEEDAAFRPPECARRIEHVEDVLTLGDKVTVVCLGKDRMGRLSFSMKDVNKQKKSK